MPAASLLPGNVCRGTSLEIRSGVRRGRRMVALECALEGAAATGTRGGLALLRSAGAGESGAVADQVLVLLAASLLVAQPPVQQGGGTQDDGSADTYGHADDDLLGIFGHAGVVRVGVAGDEGSASRGSSSLSREGGLLPVLICLRDHRSLRDDGCPRRRLCAPLRLLGRLGRSRGLIRPVTSGRSGRYISISSSSGA